MMKHRGLLVALGFTALLGLSAREARAANLTLEVIYGGSTFTFTGTPNAVSPSLTVLNGDLAGSGYSFASLGGSSSGSATPSANVADSGTLAFTGGTGGPLTVIVTEGGFTAPASGANNTLMSTQTATYSTGVTTTSSQADVGNFNDGGAVNTSLPTSPTTLFGTTPAAQNANATTGLPTYAIPFTLTTTTTFNIGSNGTSILPTDQFTSSVTVMAQAVPEPASLILMLTGMPLPLVVMGLLRRRRTAA
jgi:hypothetical protein